MRLTKLHPFGNCSRGAAKTVQRIIERNEGVMKTLLWKTLQVAGLRPVFALGRL
jgi:hypothetical protein